MLAPTKDYRAPGSLRELLYVSVPLMISSGSVSLMHALDRIFLTWSSKEALAAALPAGVLHWTILSLAFGTASYVNAFVAQYEGSDQRDRVADSVWQGVYFSIVASLVMLLFIPLAPLVFQLSGHDPRVQQLEIEYFSILFLGSGPLVLAAALSCFYSGRGQTKVIMVVNIVGALANAVVDYVLIFGKFGFPEMGIRGAAMGTIFGSLVSVAMYSVDMIWGASGRSYKLWPPQPFNNRLFRRLLRFGLPSGANLFMDLACFTLFVQVVGRMGGGAACGYESGVQHQCAGLRANAWNGNGCNDTHWPTSRRRPAGSGISLDLARVQHRGYLHGAVCGVVCWCAWLNPVGVFVGEP